MKRKILIFVGPSGCGKSTLINKLLLLENTRYVKSYTTREPRNEDKKYIHVTKNDFELLINQDKVLEYDIYNDNYYGTESFLSDTKTKYFILDTTLDGAVKLKKIFKDTSFDLKIIYLYVSIEELRERLLKRDTENLITINKRMELSKSDYQNIYKYFNYIDLMIHNESLNFVYETIIKLLF